MKDNKNKKSSKYFIVRVFSYIFALIFKLLKFVVKALVAVFVLYLIHILIMKRIADLEPQKKLLLFTTVILLNFFSLLCYRLVLIKFQKSWKKIMLKSKKGSRNSYYMLLSDILFLTAFFCAYIYLILDSTTSDYINYNMYSVNTVGPLYCQRILGTLLNYTFNYFFF